MAELGGRSFLGQRFVHGLPIVSSGHIWVIGLLVYPGKIGPSPYVTSISTSILCVKHAHGTFLRLVKMTSKSVYWRLLLCSKARER